MVLGRSKTFKPNLLARLFTQADWRLTISPARAGRIQLVTDDRRDIDCFDIASIQISNSLLWHSVEVRSNGRADILSGLSAHGAETLATAILDFINAYFAIVIDNDRSRLAQVGEVLQSTVRDSRRYLSHSDLGAIIATVSSPAAALAHPLFDRSRLPERTAGILPASLGILTDPEERHRYNETFVAMELHRFRKFFDDVSGFSLSDEQREASVRLEDNNLLVASAGSGKTATMVAKIAYILEKRLIPAGEVLVLAFNNDAADELRERIARELRVGDDELECHVSTFHALGRRIIRTVDGRPPQLANWVENAAAEARFFQELVNHEFEQDKTFRRLWIELLALYPEAEDTAKVINDDEDTNQYLLRRADGRGGTLKTLSGIVVKSLQEQRIANWLWLNSITFEYEKQFAYSDASGDTQHFHPDFHYPQANAYHEHLAIGRDGTSPFEGYVARAELKREAFRAEKADFFETSSAMADTDELISFVERQLSQRGVEPSPRSPNEILKAIEPTVVKRFQNLISVSIKHIRSRGLTGEMLRERAKALRDPRRAQRFAMAIAHLAEAYSRKLGKSGRIDFDSMIGDATAHVQSGRYKSPYSLILIDEFQDISEARANLVKALRHQHPNSKVFAVGDDWQAIYRFAGSDVTIFTQFEAQFGTSWQGKLQQTHRSNQVVAGAAAAFVQRNPEQLRKNVRSTRPGIPHSIRLIPIDMSREKTSVEKRCVQILRRLNDFAASREDSSQFEPGKKLKVLVLARYNRTIAFTVDDTALTHIEVGRMTFHRSKGTEADYTILLDVSEGEYGVPSLIQDDELLHLVLPRPEVFPYAEERRLFYVAMTRAIRGVFILFEKGNPSPYIDELVEVSPEGVRFETPAGVALQPCARCRMGFMVSRTSRAGKAFLGCDRFPVCEHTNSL